MGLASLCLLTVNERTISSDFWGNLYKGGGFCLEGVPKWHHLERSGFIQVIRPSTPHASASAIRVLADCGWSFITPEPQCCQSPAGRSTATAPWHIKVPLAMEGGYHAEVSGCCKCLLIASLFQVLSCCKDKAKLQASAGGNS